MPVVVVGIAGGTASGKSTAVARVARALGDQALLLVHDRYYRDLPQGTAALAYNFDHPSALDTDALVADLDALRAGEAVALPSYEFHHHARSLLRERVEPRPVILVEGILVLAESKLRSRLDRAVYIDTPADIRLIRRVRRDMRERGRTVEAVLRQYETTVRPMHEAYVEPSRAHADIVLDGMLPEDALAEALLAIVDPSRTASFTR